MMKCVWWVCVMMLRVKTPPQDRTLSCVRSQNFSAWPYILYIFCSCCLSHSSTAQLARSYVVTENQRTPFSSRKQWRLVVDRSPRRTDMRRNDIHVISALDVQRNYHLSVITLDYYVILDLGQ